MVMALALPGTAWTLVDSRLRACEAARAGSVELGLADRVTVLVERSEKLGRDSDQRGRYALVTARGYGPPAVTAECAAAFLAPGGRLVVSEPPEEIDGRWPADGLAALGLTVAGVMKVAGYRFIGLQRTGPCPESVPRRVGVPAKRPLW